MDISVPNYAIVLALPGILTILGTYLYLTGIVRTLEDGKVHWLRFTGIAITLIALAVGLRAFWQVANPGDGYLYQLTFHERRSVIAHYVDGFLPLVALIVFCLVEFRTHRKLAEE